MLRDAGVASYGLYWALWTHGGDERIGARQFQANLEDMSLAGGVVSDEDLFDV